LSYAVPILIVSLLLITFSYEHVFAESETLQLTPTDDAYVVIDLSNLDDPVTDLNTGDMEWMKIWYLSSSTETDLNVVSLGHLKFDLSQVNLDDITSATLNLNSLGRDITDNSVSVFKADDLDWDESSLTFQTKPAFSLPPIDIAISLSSTNWMQWDVTNAIKQNNSTDITFVISLSKVLSVSEEAIFFHSKESLVSETHPFLELTIDTPSEQTTNNYLIKKIPVLEDAYVGTNYAVPQGFEEMRNLNTGTLNFTKIWYSYDAVEAGDLFASLGYLKFDLSELNPDNVIDAQLKMYNHLVSTSGGDKIISVFVADDTEWSETDLTFNNKPELDKKIVTTTIDEVNSWISWNVTEAIKQNNDAELTLSIIYDSFMPGHEEQTIFNSKESLENQPYLEIVYDESNEGGGCLIATATYGSELAPQVQQLRELRDNHLLQTSYGSKFMAGFNQFYYSFSPIIADLERENPIFKELVKLGITPLISSLSLLNYADLDSEFSVLGYGLSIIALNIGIYFVSPIMGIKFTLKLSKYFKASN